MAKVTSLQNPLVKHLTKLRKERPYRLEQNRCLLIGSRFIDGPPTLSLETASPEVLKKIAGHPTDAIAELPLPPEQSLANHTKILALDGVSDPGNVGTLARTACALGWTGLLLLPGTADPFNPKALRAAAGTTIHLAYQWASDLSSFPDHQKLVASLKGETAPPPSEKRLLLLGNEGQGPSQALSYQCLAVTIPMNSEVESLNVAAAGAILMHEL